MSRDNLYKLQKDVVVSNSASETRENIAEITAKSDRAEWGVQDVQKPSLEERQKPSPEGHQKPVIKHDESKDPHAPKSLSMDSVRGDFKQTIGGGPDRAELLVQMKNDPAKTTGTLNIYLLCRISSLYCTYFQ